MITILNNTKHFVNQYFDVKDVLEMKGHERVRTCNVSSAAMITNENVNVVLRNFLNRFGFNRKYQWESNLIKYLEKKGHNCKSITKLSWPIARKITDEEIKKMMNELKYGNVIFYHKKGHYYLIVGYHVNENNDLFFIANDPAGDRKLPLNLRERESGKNVYYPVSMIREEKIYGRNWSVKI